MINRIIQKELLRLAQSFPVVTLTGPRQSGKTTLCKMAFPEYDYVNLENITLREQVASDPQDFLHRHEHGLIVDEVQYLPDLFSYIQIWVDDDRKRRVILTGSSNFSLMEKVSQSLAGRAAVLTLLPLSFEELAVNGINTDCLMLNGGYPAVWGNLQLPKDVYANYYMTYVERDLRQLLNVRNLSSFHQFIRLSAGRVSCEFVASEFANELGVDIKTIRQWEGILETSYITFMLPPYYRNIGKRIVKTSKRYFMDTGLLCYLLDISSEQQLADHPLRGAIFENMVVAEMVKRYFNRGKIPRLYYYRDKSQNEVDVVDEISFDRLCAYEIKSSRTYHLSFNKGLDYFRKLYGDRVVSSMVLYDGQEKSVSPDNGFINFRDWSPEIG